MTKTRAQLELEWGNEEYFSTLCRLPPMRYSSISVEDIDRIRDEDPNVWRLMSAYINERADEIVEFNKWYEMVQEHLDGE